MRAKRVALVAFDVAAFVSSQTRPEMPNLEQEYPDRTLKPIDNGYGPFADEGAFMAWLDERSKLKDPYSYAVVNDQYRAVGIVTLAFRVWTSW